MKIRFLCAGLLLLLSSSAFAADLTGTWQVTISITAPDGTTQKDLGVAVLQQAGNALTGSVGPDENRLSPISEGTIKDNKVIIKVSPRPERTMTFELTVTGEKLVGTVEQTGSPQKRIVELIRAVAAKD
jgi:hypothetical protein